MFRGLKRIIPPVVLLAVVLAVGAVIQTPRASADLAGTGAGDGVWFLDNYLPGAASSCAGGNPREVRLFGTGLVSHIDESDGVGAALPVIQIASNDEIIVCVEPALPSANVVFDTTGSGEWNNAHCAPTLATECIDEEGVGDDALTVVGATNNVSMIAVTFSCNGPSVQTIDITQDDAPGDETVAFRIMCKGNPASMQLGATPTTVESDPAYYNTSHSLIRAVITDSAGNPVLPGTTVSVTSDCGISSEAVDTLEERNEALFNEGTGTHGGLNLSTINAEFGTPPLANFLDIATFSDRDTPVTSLKVDTLEVDTNAYPDSDPDKADGVPNHSEALVIFHAEGCAPGVHTVTFEINNPGNAADLEASVDITVVGPPAFITITAAPTELICGEKSEISVSVTDAVNHAVSDNTPIEVITNYGGVLAGTGTSLTSGQPVNPLSSTTVEIFDGIGTAYLLTSPEHVGPYEVLAAGGTVALFGQGLQEAPRVTSQVTVTCTLGSQTQVTAPDTGTGTVIRPPNTGEAGLADHGGSGTLLVIAGAGLIALAVIARRRFARD